MVLGRDPPRLADAYFRGDIDIEGNLFAAISLKDHLHLISISVKDQLRALHSALLLRGFTKASTSATANYFPSKGQTVKEHSKDENCTAVQFHYDVSNAFYALWLDRAMVYKRCRWLEKDAFHAVHQSVCLPGWPTGYGQQYRVPYGARKIRDRRR